MKQLSILCAGLSLTFCASLPTPGATTIVSDSFTAVNVNSGFLLGEGVNSGINPPTTRLTGASAADLRYIRRGNKNETAYTISNNRCNITQGSQSGRFTISANGTDPFDFASALGADKATPQNPVVYDIGISMNNKVATNDTSVGRMTFAFGTVEAGGGSWSFGIQIIPTINTNYNIIKRVKTAASGLAAEVNSVITNAGANGTMVNFLMRVTDAGTETDSYSSRVQVSMDAGQTWFYDTKTDPALVNGWRFDAATRFVTFDQAPNGGADMYDNFSITLISAVNGGTLTITNSSGTANIGVQGEAGQSYVLERSQDLSAWSGIFTNTADVNGSFQFSETPPSNPAFYRSRKE